MSEPAQPGRGAAPSSPLTSSLTSSHPPAASTASTALTRSFDALTPEVMRDRGSLKWTYYPDDVIGAWVAEMDLGTAPSVMAVLQRSLREGTLGYLPPATAQTACQETARYQQEAFGWEVPAQDVSLLPDVLSALEAVIAFHTREGSPVIVPTPAYMPFLSIPSHHGRGCLQVPALERRNHDGSPRWELDLGGIEAAMSGGAGLLVLCNPWNPVGRVLSEEELDGVAALSSRYGVPVFADEIHAPLVLDPGLAHVPYASRPQADPALTYTATAVSKGWNIPGLKCAQLIASGQARSRWEADARSANLAYNASLLGTQAAVAALRDGQDWLAEVRAYIQDNSALVRQALEPEHGVEVTLPEGSYLAWLDCRGLGLESPAKFFVSEAKVAMNEGTTFGDAWSGFCRLNLATGRGIEEETVRRIVEAVHSLRQSS